MSSSDKISLRRCGCGYLIAAAAYGVFGLAYEQFSHGVYSDCMLLFFLIPLLGGALPSFLLLLARHAPGRTTRRLWACAVATLSVGCCLAGVFEIYGTVSSLLVFYWAAGGGLTVCGLGHYLLSDVRSRCA